LFIWDDASTDQSWEIIQSYTDPRIRAFQNPSRRRPVYGINRVISELAAGEFIAIHHSDDVWLPGKLAAQVSFLDSHAKHGAVFSRAQIIDERGDPFTDTSHFYFSVFDQPNRSRHEWLNHFFFTGNALCHPSALVRKTFFDTCGLYGRGFTLLTDYDAWIRLCLHYEIHVLPEALVQFRVLDGGANASMTPDSPVRGEFERLQAVRNYLQITDFEEMAAIFPQARQYERPGYFDAHFVLAMMALDARDSRPTLLFGLVLLFQALRDPPRAEKLKEHYGFDLLRFHELKGANAIFAGSSTPAQLADQAKARRLEAELRVAEQRLVEIEGSAGWRLLNRVRAVRLLLAPRGSARERLWYAALRALKLLPSTRLS
jgi:glycosyltransferase involved in cell wall biosynthesis